MPSAAAAPAGSTTKRRSTRHDMVVSAADLLRERGAAGVTIDSVLHRSGAPRGSVYHHFPGGRSQILREALQYAGDAIVERMVAAADRGALAMLRDLVEFGEHALTASDFTAGSPVLAAATGPSDHDLPLLGMAGDIYRRWLDQLSLAFRSDGFGPADARSLASTCVAALEGAVVLCRVERTVEHLTQTARQLEFLVKSREFVNRSAASARR